MKLIPGRFGRAADSTDMLRLLGVKVLPVEGMPERVIEGVRVMVRRFVRRDGRRGMNGLRVLAVCDDCGKWLAVGRMGQHSCCWSPERKAREAVRQARLANRRADRRSAAEARVKL